MKKHRQTKTKSETSKPLHEPEPDAAGIDVGANEIWVAVAPDRTEEPLRRFGAFDRELKAIVQWLGNCGSVPVGMEATGMYWIPLYQLLADSGLKVCLVNGRHVKNVPGRKSDVRDCQWLQYLHSVGLLRASYRPEQAICAARSIYRYRQNLLTQAAQHVQHMQASLDQMNIKLHHVIDDLTGITGLAIIEAILDGKRDPQQLAKLRDHRIKASEETIVKALEGDWLSEHLFVPGSACVRIMKPALAKCCAERPVAAKIGFARPCAWRPLLCITIRAIWEINTAACAPNWVLPRLSPPWPTN